MGYFLFVDRADLLCRKEDKICGPGESVKTEVSLNSSEEGAGFCSFFIVVLLHLIKWFLDGKRPCSHRIM